MSDTCRFLDDKGTFCVENAENYSYLYFPAAGEGGVKSAVTPNLGGDCKVDQNTYITEPVSAENLHNNRGGRNFWCVRKGLGAWSAAGASAESQAAKFTPNQEKSRVTAGILWHCAERSSEKYGLSAFLTTFAPLKEPLEILYVEIKNISGEKIRFTPTAAIPLYARSADNIRDHRHVTSLLHRIRTTEAGVLVTPTLSFDERGHRMNETTYFVCGFDGRGNAPEAFYPIVEDFIGEGGSLEHPRAVLENRPGVPAGAVFAGFEAMGGLRFQERTLEPGEMAAFTIMTGAVNAGAENGIVSRFRTGEQTRAELERVKEYWDNRITVSFHTGDKVFDRFLRWVGFQPELRRIYGCSFLPHHDYGRGGRGWRDLWQDCLALLIMNPDGVRGMLLNNFGGVRMDGTNATIIGSRPGEFLADRNHITRVWMDHGVWPFLTTKLYIDQTGDLGLLDQETPYFKDGQAARGTGPDREWNEECGTSQRTRDGGIYCGSVLEHLLIQNVTAALEVGAHNQIRLRDADWNDALDMAPEKGESVAFTNAYAGNLLELAELLEEYAERTGKRTVLLAEELDGLLGALIRGLPGEAAARKESGSGYISRAGGRRKASREPSAEEKRELLASYIALCLHDVSGEKKEYPIETLSAGLRRWAEGMMEHIRRTEWIADREKEAQDSAPQSGGWFNGYYDNHGRRVEGIFESGVRMMLTSQVFAVMAGTAGVDRIRDIVRSADKYLYRPEEGGYCLNTDFGEVKTDLGRMFGFAYGEKENGAVFSHMAVMFANALYRRGFAAEGFRALDALEKQAINFEKSRIYPGIPEYFNSRGRGMYHYLTGAASWYLLTAVTQMFGARGSIGDLLLEPKLLGRQFDEKNRAELCLTFAGKRLRVIYENAERKEYGTYRIGRVSLDGKEIAGLSTDGARAKLDKDLLTGLAEEKEHEIYVLLL